MAAAVVTDCGADVFRNGAELANEGLDGFGFQRDVAGNRLVHVGNVRIVMFAVMDFHCHRVDVRFECVFRVGKCR